MASETGWHIIDPVEGFDGLCFQRGEFIAASKRRQSMRDDSDYEWELFRVRPEKSLESHGTYLVALDGNDQGDGSHLTRAFAFIDDRLSQLRDV